MMKNVFFVLVAALLIAVGSPAKADIIYTLNYDGCSGGCGNGQGTSNNTFGYIALHQVNATTVSVTETLTGNSQNLNDNNYFVNTGSGNHEPLAFNLDKPVTISNVSPSTYFTAGSGSVTISGGGTYSDYIACTSNCGSGASNAQMIGQSLTFSTNTGTLSVSDFTANSSGYLFASDIIGGKTGNTGEVFAQASTACNTGTTSCAGANAVGSPAPEPASLALLGSGLMALAAARRRRFRQSV